MAPYQFPLMTEYCKKYVLPKKLASPTANALHFKYQIITESSKLCKPLFYFINDSLFLNTAYSVT